MNVNKERPDTEHREGDEKADRVRKSIREEHDALRENLRSTGRGRILLTVLKFLGLIIILVAVPLYFLIFKRDLLEGFRSFEDVTAYLQRYQSESIFIYIGLQILQIVITVIPGQFFQIAAGYLYGFFWALLYSLIGSAIGAAMAYFLARLLGRDLLHLFFSAKQLERFVKLLNSRKAYIVTLIIYLIPGLPKDIMGYAAGLSEMNFRAFLLISLAGRTPAMCISILVGYLYYGGHMVGVGAVAAIVVLITLLCVIKRRSISAFLDRLYDKISEPEQKK